MITINFQEFGKSFGLRLRLYKDGETKFVSVNKLLQGKLQKRHWNAKKQCFISSAPFSKENNEILSKIKQKYQDLALDWDGSLTSFMLRFKEDAKEREESKKTINWLFEHVINELKKNRHPDGSGKGSHEAYEKTVKRLHEFCKYKNISFDELSIEDFTSDLVNSIFDWIEKTRKGKGKEYVSKALHSVLTKADSAGWFNMDNVKYAKWYKRKRASNQKYNTLSKEQCKKLIQMPIRELPESKLASLYRDFCVFLIFTGQSPCDAISMTKSDIQDIDGVKYLVFKRRKISEKQSIPCTVPINPVMRDIIDRWKKLSQDGYLFPIRNKKKIANQKTINGDIKHFVNRLNMWLKRLGKVLGCNSPLHTYTFRHTAITNYISRGIPVVYVANMMGTSVANCEQIYYNNRGDISSRDKVLSAISF